MEGTFALTVVTLDETFHHIDSCFSVEPMIEACPGARWPMGALLVQLRKI